MSTPAEEHTHMPQFNAPSEFAGQSCGIYPRVSTRAQAKKSRTSLQDQEQACRDYAAFQGMVVVEDCVKPESYTSTKRLRPVLNELIAKMKAQRVRHLIVDRVDRLTRQGQLVASLFLWQFHNAGILLHVVSLGGGDEDGADDEDDPGSALVVRTDKDAKDFLDAAYIAQQENKKRARITKRARRSRAKDGHYIHGSSAPYGFTYVPCEYDEDGHVTDYRLEPDTRPYSERGFPTTFAPHPYAARKKMLQLYAGGTSCQQIAHTLVDAGVPTRDALLHRREDRGWWWDTTVQYLVVSPLNEGVLTNFRHTYETADPDDDHEEEWTKKRPVPLEKQQVVKPAHGSPEPLMDEALAARLAQRRANRKVNQPAEPGATPAGPALLVGGLALCGMGCGNPIHAHSVRRRRQAHEKVYQYYYCKRHMFARASCPGFSFPVAYLDPIAWEAFYTAMVALRREGEGYDYHYNVEDEMRSEFEDEMRSEFEDAAEDEVDIHIEMDSYLDKLARKVSDLATENSAADDPLAELRAGRSYFARQVALLSADLAHMGPIGRDSHLKQINQFEANIAEADRQIAAHERQAARVAERRQLLNTYLHQWHEYSGFLGRLDPYQPQDIPVMAEVMRLVGARLTVRKDERGWPDIHVHLDITPAVAQPWFTPEALQDAQARLDKRRADALDSAIEPDTGEQYRPLPSTSSSY
jgi:DNA invertase Pin-like site-specific DNA recombinase